MPLLERIQSAWASGEEFPSARLSRPAFRGARSTGFGAQGRPQPVWAAPLGRTQPLGHEVERLQHPRPRHHLLEQLCFALTELALPRPVPDRGSAGQRRPRLAARPRPDPRRRSGHPGGSDQPAHQPRRPQRPCRHRQPPGAAPLLPPSPAGPRRSRSRSQPRRDPAGQHHPPGVLRIAAPVSASQADATASLRAMARRLQGCRLLGRDLELVLAKPFQAHVRASLEVEVDGPPEALMGAVHRCLDACIRASPPPAPPSPLPRPPAAGGLRRRSGGPICSCSISSWPTPRPA